MRPKRDWLPVALGALALIAVGVTIAAWRPWDAPPREAVDGGAEAAAVAARPSPAPAPAPEDPEPGDAPIAAPAPDRLAEQPAPPDAAEAPAPDHAAEAVPAEEQAKRSPKKRRRPSDASVLAGIRRRARKQCRGDGGGRIKIDFLIQDDGRPALVRSSAPGDPRSGCVEKKVRGARFMSGTSRRSSLAVSFDP